MHSYEQLQLYSLLAKAGNLIVHVDATAGIIRRAEYVKRQLYLLSAVVDSSVEQIPCISVSDCITEDCRAEDVEFWLRRLRNDVSRSQHVNFNSENSTPAVVVVDFSWVLLHACASVFCGTTLVKYLHNVFEKSIGHPVKDIESNCSLFSCSSHFMSRAARNLSRYFSQSEKDVRELMLHSIAGLICSATLHDAAKLWNTMLQVFGTSTITPQWVDSYNALLDILGHVPQNIQKKDYDEENAYEEANSDHFNKTTIRGRSPYGTFFDKPIECERKSHQVYNAYFKPAALDFIHKVWLPLYGLWDQPSLTGIKGVSHYLTNAKVESWFG